MRAIAANAGRYPISAQCRLLGVARSTYYSMRSRPGRPAAPDPAAPAVVAAHAASKGRYGSRKIKASLERSGVTCIWQEKSRHFGMTTFDILALAPSSPALTISGGDGAVS